MTRDSRLSGRSKKKGLSYFSRTVLLFNIVVVFFLLCCYLSLYVSPAHFWPLAFFGLAFPFIVILNILFIFYWIIRGRWLFLLSTLTILLGYNIISGFFQINFDNQTIPTSAANSVVKVMSYNVRLFDLYNWTRNKKTRNEMLDFLQKEEADILCLQEIYTDDDGAFLTLDSIKLSLKSKNVHIHNTKTLREKNHWGIATFSSYPIVHKGVINFGEGVNNICIFTDIKIKNDTVRVYNMHLQSIHFRQEDYKYLEDLNSEGKKTEISGSKKILRRLKIAFRKRATQVDMVAEHINRSPYKVIVCGDFNDPPASYTYKTISANLTDAFKESGNGLGRTYNGKFPSFRIDYILHSKDFNSYRFQTLPEEFSDHNAINGYLRIGSSE